MACACRSPSNWRYSSVLMSVSTLTWRRPLQGARVTQGSWPSWPPTRRVRVDEAVALFGNRIVEALKDDLQQLCAVKGITAS